MQFIVERALAKEPKYRYQSCNEFANCIKDYMEIEFENTEEANKFETPDWVIKELTYDKRFTNAKLAKSLIKAADFYKD